MLNLIVQFIPYIQTIFNTSIIRYINTGDRVLDSSLIALSTAIVGMIFINWYFIFKTIRDYILINFMKEQKFNPETVNKKEYSPEMLLTYKLTFNLTQEHILYRKNIEFDHVYDWIMETYNNLIVENGTEMTYDFKTRKMTLVKDSSTYRNLNMPIKRFIKNNRYEYIILSGKTLYCNSENELFDFIDTFNIGVKDDNVNKTQKFVYELCDDGKLSKKCNVNPNKTFDTLFFTEKERIIKMLDKFKNKTLYPKGLSLDNIILIKIIILYPFQD